MGIAYKCKVCGYILESSDQLCPECDDGSIFSGGQTLERKAIRERIRKVVPPIAGEKSDVDAND